MAKAEQFMRIGQLSKETGVSVDAIRFYERNRLLRTPARTGGGFRLYSADDLSTLQFIRNLQMLGFTLKEIREFLSLRTNDMAACSEVRKKLGHKLNDIHAKRDVDAPAARLRANVWRRVLCDPADPFGGDEIGFGCRGDHGATNHD